MDRPLGHGRQVLRSNAAAQNMMVLQCNNLIDSIRSVVGCKSTIFTGHAEAGGDDTDPDDSPQANLSDIEE